jgi:hypothetical protein
VRVRAAGQIGIALLALATGCRTTMVSSGTPGKEAGKRWELLLDRVVDDQGYVDYDTLESERGALDDYVAWLADERAWPGRITKDWHAQYLNAYNALVLFQVLERGRPDSVLDVQGWVPWPGFAFFHSTQFQLGIEKLTLSEIENERIRWKEMDLRDHSAMNCASRSCPPMRQQLYRGGGLAAQLDDQMLAWLSDEERGVRIEGDVAVFNPIFDWFARDFHFFSAGQDPCTIAAEYVGDPDKSRKLLELAERECPRRFFEYDWRLNQIEQ